MATQTLVYLCTNQCLILIIPWQLIIYKGSASDTLKSCTCTLLNVVSTIFYIFCLIPFIINTARLFLRERARKRVKVQVEITRLFQEDPINLDLLDLPWCLIVLAWFTMKQWWPLVQPGRPIGSHIETEMGIFFKLKICLIYFCLFYAHI